MDVKLLETMADSLRAARRNRTPIKTLTETYPDFTVADAYKVQLLNVERELNQGRRIIGKKIGLTSRGMQQMLGVSEPDYGVLLDDMIFEAGSPISLGRLIQPKIEAEIAFVLKKRLKGPGVTLLQVLQATEGVVPAFEIIDSRIEKWKIKLADTVADNASGAGIVPGDVLTAVKNIDLKTVGMVLEHNGVMAATAAGAEVLGHPALAVAWLANKLAEYDQSLEPGEIILSGALTKAWGIASGDVFRASFGGLGSVKAKFVA
ncbi:MAG: fumarylacetoacetate hydrolase family protein [Thermodesulfobacteriota bacterium]